MRAVAIICICGLAACSVGPDFTPPKPDVPVGWHDQATAAISAASNPDSLWWNRFNDPTLTTLMSRAIADNPNLQQALLRVIISHQSVIAAAAAGLPTVGGNASYKREQLGLKGILESKGAYSSLDQLAAPINSVEPGLGTETAEAATGAINGLTQPVNLYQYGLSSSWELDLFGRVRRSVEQAQASAEAQKEAANDALVMLESQVGTEYFQLRAAQYLQQQQQENIRAAQDSFNLTINRAERGLDTDIDVSQARTQLDSKQSQIETYQKQAQQAIDQINLLAGQQPGTLDALLSPPAPLPQIPNLIGIGIPAALARRRPDIRQAEAELHAATAGVGVAVASFYPDISLTGSAGLRATDAGYITRWASLFYSAGPSVSLPIFEGGALIGNLRTARAEQASAALNYRSTVLNALREVEDALVALRTDQASRDQFATTAQSAGLSYYLANNRYTHGLSSYLQALDAERALVAARQQLAQADALLATDAVTLYTALGGGWIAAADQPPKPQIHAAPPPLPAAIDGLAAGPDQ